jgi:tetratricopeptide (TPR) repeat protein
VTATYRHVIAYGSSMGGYAAIRYGGWAGAHAALALSPQFTLDPRRPPFDRRWPEHASEIRFLHEHGRDAVEQAFVAYDPSDEIDDAHVQLLHTLTRVIPVPLPGSGHPSTGFLSDLSMLHRISLEVCRETFEPESFIAEAGRRREESAQFHFVRALRASDLNERYRLITQAAARAPTHIGTLHALAETAIKIGLPEVALDALDSAARAEPGRAQFLRGLAHEKAGRLEQAIEIMEELCRLNTGSPHWRTTLARLKRRRALQVWIYRPWQRLMGRHQSG